MTTLIELLRSTTINWQTAIPVPFFSKPLKASVSQDVSQTEFLPSFMLWSFFMSPPCQGNPPFARHIITQKSNSETKMQNMFHLEYGAIIPMFLSVLDTAQTHLSGQHLSKWKQNTETTRNGVRNKNQLYLQITFLYMFCFSTTHKKWLVTQNILALNIMNSAN